MVDGTEKSINMKNTYGIKMKCALCDDIIQSKHRHDFVWCKCRKSFVDGGSEYFRAGGYTTSIKEGEEKDEG